jgi:hypothetical protein
MQSSPDLPTIAATTTRRGSEEDGVDSGIRWCAAIAISALACGCTTLTRTSGPAPIPEEGTQLQAAAQVGPAYERYHAAGTDEGRRRLVRDEFIANRVGQLDVDFLGYVRSVSSSKRSLDAATEAAQLTLGVAATLVGGTQAKENLAAAIALITGGKATYDKHYFDNKGLDAVLSTMISRRKEVFVRIVQGLGVPTTEYGIVQAKADLDDYYNAGTLEGAYVSIQATAIEREKAATEELKFVQEAVRNIPANLAPQVRATKRTLSMALLDSSKLNQSQTRAALATLGVLQANMPSTLEKQAELLRAKVRAARTPDEVEVVHEALQQAGIVK